MRAIRIFLIFSSVLIYGVTAVAISAHGFNWPAVAIMDLQAMSWRTQFDIDFITYLMIVATWISWREGFGLRGHVLGVLSIVIGGMFTFPYLLFWTFKAKGDPRRLLFGSRHSAATLAAEGLRP